KEVGGAFTFIVDMAVGGFGGEGREDLLVEGFGDAFAYFFYADRTLQVLFPVPVFFGPETGGGLGGDGRRGFGTRDGFGDVDVLQGRREGALAPLSFSSFVAPSSKVRVVAFRGESGRSQFGVLSNRELDDLPALGTVEFTKRVAIHTDAVATGTLTNSVA